MKNVSERSRDEIGLTFTYNGSRVTPGAARYRIDCLSTGQVIVDWTDFTPASAEYTVVVTPDQNRIIRSGNRSERRQLAVEANPGTDYQFTDTYDWLVVNKRGIS